MLCLTHHLPQVCHYHLINWSCRVWLGMGRLCCPERSSRGTCVDGFRVAVHLRMIEDYRERREKGFILVMQRYRLV